MPIHEIIQTRGVPVKIFTDQIEAEARQQLIDLAESGLVVGHVAAMPDVHYGMGATVGSVFASDKYICPNAVGVDIGCGMAAVPLPDLSAESISWEIKESIHKEIKDRVPTGINIHGKPRKAPVLDNLNRSAWLSKQITQRTACQIGTLGGGNHFIELVKDSTGLVWIFLHSGSRNIGKVTAENYNALAKAFMKMKEFKQRNLDLNFLEIDTEEGRNYLRDMEWCQAFALDNRQDMLTQVATIIEEKTGSVADFSKAVNIHHNYCTCEECEYIDVSGNTIRQKLWVTRKGATSAKQGQFGLIPGSMGTGSFLVKGLGNSDSWQSSSHGAGRSKSRTKAKLEIKQSDFEKSMEGIVCETVEELRDEAPQAYKDINSVMDWQSDLVEIVTKFQPLINVKGFESSVPPWKLPKIAVIFENSDSFQITISKIQISKSTDNRKQNFSEFIPYSEWKQKGAGLRKGNVIQTWVQTEEDPLRKFLLKSTVVSSDTEKAILRIDEIQKREKI
ncbi:RtcB family protein [Leptospira weilii]|uniref:RtcB family protein n=1 Tax=Leptospira weilii TaxID=28184 RepID=UPI00256ED108|nr:RtcB family protein [Leptospira weilii]MDL5247513.1 RtcB family protein [Leptospira weilii]